MHKTPNSIGTHLKTQRRAYRLKVLRNIAERDRTDAQWDELNQLEIELAVQSGKPQPGPAKAKSGRHAAPNRPGKTRRNASKSAA